MSTFLSAVILTFGALISLFIIWKKLREDYQDSLIFTVSFLALLGAGLVYVISQFLGGGITIWSTAMTFILSGVFWARRFAMRPFEVLEAQTPAVFLFMLFVSLVWTLFNKPTLGFGAEPILALVSLSLFVYLSGHFRRFLWYPSGKIGLASLASLSFYSWARAGLSVFLPAGLIFTALPLDLAFGFFDGILTMVVIYIRSGRKFSQDLGPVKLKIWKIR